MLLVTQAATGLMPRVRKMTRELVKDASALETWNTVLVENLKNRITQRTLEIGFRNQQKCHNFPFFKLFPLIHIKCPIEHEPMIRMSDKRLSKQFKLSPLALACLACGASIALSPLSRFKLCHPIVRSLGSTHCSRLILLCQLRRVETDK